MPFYPHHGPRLIGLQTKQQRAVDGAHIDDHHANRSADRIVFRLKADERKRVTVSLSLHTLFGPRAALV